MTTQQYLSHSAISNSKLNWIKKSPLHFKYYSENGIETSKAQELGRILQLAILKPCEFTRQYFMLPTEDKRTLIGKLTTKRKMEENVGKTGLSKDLYDTIIEMQKSAFSHKQVKKLLFSECLKPFFWTDEDTLVECKARPEIYQKGKWMADLITTHSADPDTFIYEIVKYGYHRKAAFCLDGVKENIPYYLIVVEKQAPFAVNVIKLPKVVIEKGRKEYKSLLKQFAICNLNNRWPGFETKEINEKTFKTKLKAYLAV